MGGDKQGLDNGKYILSNLIGFFFANSLFCKKGGNRDTTLRKQNVIFESKEIRKILYVSNMGFDYTHLTVLSW